MGLEDTLHYTFSTIPQVLGAVIAVVAAFLLFGIGAVGRDMKGAAGDLRRKLSGQRRRFVRAISTVMWVNVLVVVYCIVALTQTQSLAVRPTEARIAMWLAVIGMVASFGVNTWALYSLAKRPPEAAEN